LSPVTTLAKPRHVQHVYLEGGHTLAAALLKAQLVNRLFIYLAPKFLSEGTSAIGVLDVANIADALCLNITDIKSFQDDWQTDVRLTAYPLFKK
jgi:diaminohydroxyphosphoribosylaminopyrimidine deaminase / 5-amino-6-(5-phosphoribosylamino)uracil reductase